MNFYVSRGDVSPQNRKFLHISPDMPDSMIVQYSSLDANQKAVYDDFLSAIGNDCSVTITNSPMQAEIIFIGNDSLVNGTETIDYNDINEEMDAFISLCASLMNEN